jgi:hypothetical protein
MKCSFTIAQEGKKEDLAAVPTAVLESVGELVNFLEKSSSSEDAMTKQTLASPCLRCKAVWNPCAKARSDFPLIVFDRALG